MTENSIPETPAENPRPGQRLRLTSLAPVFDAKQHQIYADLLSRAIGAEGTRNIALTGAYGTGKSSVLEGLRETHGKRFVELSLSTISPAILPIADPGKGGDQDAAGARTNQIQKEIVKQLLYKLPPDSVPRSRFHRTSAPDKKKAWKFAGLVGAATFVVLFGLGLIQPLVEGLLPSTWRQIIAYVLVFALAVGTSWLAKTAMPSHLSLGASVQTGPATITLSKQADTYFDEYLDEIVYFFQVSKRDIVIIEDIDRFEAVHVFDTLRALNSLLNISQQIDRRIVFVYAFRDSVFEQVGGEPEDDEDEVRVDGAFSSPRRATEDRAKATLKSAGRTKFFDVIIPVVPFVSANNARDVMSSAMRSPDFKISAPLIRLAARHVADMRLIHNIRNEFEVYRSRLVVPEDHVPNISDDLVFAIVLFKNTHLADFEKIRHLESTLDNLYAAWRELVKENREQKTRQLNEHRRARTIEAAKIAQAARLGRHLTDFVGTLQAATVPVASQPAITLTGPATATNLDDPETWAEIASGTPQTIALKHPQGYAPITLTFSAEELGNAIGTAIVAEDWETIDLVDIDAQIADDETQLYFLRHHSWKELCAHPEFKVDVSKLGLGNSTGTLVKGSVSFDEALGAVLESDLARDLVRHGFLTSHFALHSSSYYGTHLGRDAMEYIRRCIEPGTPDMSFEIGKAEVIQLLREQDAETSDTADLFSDESVFNVSILDHLLSDRPAAAATVARRLSRMGVNEREFVDTYAAQGSHPGAMLALLAPQWNEVVRYAAVAAPVDPDARLGVVDDVLRALPSTRVDANLEVADFFEKHYRDLDAISRPDSARLAKIAMSTVEASGAVLQSLQPLNDKALTAAVALRLYPITGENLRAIVQSEPIALDVLRDNKHAYAYVLDQLEIYLDLVDSSSKSFRVVANAKSFATVLTDVAREATPALLARVVDASGVDCRVARLGDVAVEAWPHLTAGLRTDPTLENTAEYLKQIGMDKNLGTLLKKHRSLAFGASSSEVDRRVVAVAVLAAAVEIPSTFVRVQLAASVAPGTIDASDIVPERGDLIARLLKRRLIADDADAFSADLMPDWATLEQSIAASKNYSTFVTPSILDATYIPQLLRSAVVPSKTKLAVVSSISDFLTGASGRQVRDISAALVSTGWRMPYESLEALRNAGATAIQLVALIAARREKLSDAHMKALLEALGGTYGQVARGGRGRPNFPANPSHEYVLDRLVGDTVKRVEPKALKLQGQRLVAHLA